MSLPARDNETLNEGHHSPFIDRGALSSQYFLRQTVPNRQNLKLHAKPETMCLCVTVLCKDWTARWLRKEVRDKEKSFWLVLLVWRCGPHFFIGRNFTNLFFPSHLNWKWLLCSLKYLDTNKAFFIYAYSLEHPNSMLASKILLPNHAEGNSV